MRENEYMGFPEHMPRTGPKRPVSDELPRSGVLSREDQLRLAALNAAVAGDRSDIPEKIETRAEEFYKFLTGRFAPVETAAEENPVDVGMSHAEGYRRGYDAGRTARAKLIDNVLGYFANQLTLDANGYDALLRTKLQFLEGEFKDFPYPPAEPEPEKDPLTNLKEAGEEFTAQIKQSMSDAGLTPGACAQCGHPIRLIGGRYVHAEDHWQPRHPAVLVARLARNTESTGEPLGSEVAAAQLVEKLARAAGRKVPAWIHNIARQGAGDLAPEDTQSDSEDLGHS